MAIENNPLKQYFRRPAVYIKLPSEGKYYASGVVDIPPNSELPIYPMTAIDEITVKTPDALYNGSAMADLIKSCVPNIKDPWAINSIDVDAIFIAIKAAAGGQEMEIESTCPNCNNFAKYGLNLINMLMQMKPADYEKIFEINDLKIKFRPLIFKEMNNASIAQAEIQRTFVVLNNETDEQIKIKRSQEALKEITTLTMRLLTGSIEYIDTPSSRVEVKEYIFDFLQQCDKKTYVAIRDHNAALRATSEIKPLQIKCNECSHEYEQPFTLNTSDFFG